MNLNIFRNNVQNKKFYPGSYAHLRQKVQIKRQPLRVVLPKKSVMLVITLIMATFFLFIFSLYYIQTSDNFKIRNVVFEGDEVEAEFQQEFVVLTQGENIFGINILELENNISKKINNLKSVIVTKSFPDKIRVFIDKYTPTLISISFDKLEVFDENLSLVYMEELQQALELTEIEKSSLEGTVNINSNEFQEYVILNLADEEKEGFSWDAFTDEEKKEFALRLQEGINQKMNSHFSQNLENISDRFIGTQITNYYDYLLQKEGAISMQNRIENYDFTLKLYNEVQKLNLTVVKSEWLSRTTLKITLDSGKNLFFSPRRNLQDQARDLETALVNGILNSASNIDFRTSNFSSWN